MITRTEVLATGQCRFCTAALTVHQRVTRGVCDDPRCRGAYVRENAGRLEAREQSAREAIAARHARRHSTAAGLAPGDGTLVAIVPASTRRLRRSVRRRWSEFAAHLRSLIAQALALGPDPDAERGGDATTTPVPPPVTALLRAGCAACRGLCCNGGGTHAYQKLSDLRRYLARFPSRTPDEIVRHYERHVPPSAYEGSCIFHDHSGCTLPRELRSELCNAFYCEALESLRARLAESKATHVFVAAMQGRKVRRVSSIPNP